MKTPAEVVFESRVYSPAVESRWGVRDALCTREKEGAVAPLRRYARAGETQAFQHVVFDDLVLDEESELRLVLRAEEIDYDWRYGVLETVQQPYYDDLGSGGLSVSTQEPGTYTFAGCGAVRFRSRCSTTRSRRRWGCHRHHRCTPAPCCAFRPTRTGRT